MTWSPLVTGTRETTDRSARSQSVKGVVLHHAATTSLEGILSLFQPGGREVSAHLAVKDGQRVGAVPEEFRAWSLSSAAWDSWAMTVECANESTNGWTISDASHESLAQLVADWARRYGFKPHRSGDPSTWTVLGHREVYSIHGASYATACPGGMNLDYIVNRAQQLLGGGNPQQKDDEMTYALINRAPGDQLPGVPKDAVFVGTGTDPLVWVSNYGPELINGVVLAEWDHTAIAARISQVGLRGSGADINKVYKSMADAKAGKPAYILGGGSVNVGDITVPADPALVKAVEAQTAVLGELLKATKALNPPG